MAKTVFDLKNSKKIFFEVSFQFSLLNKLKNIFCFRWNLKKLFKKKFAHFRVTAQIFWGLATKERGNLKTLNFGIGVLQ